MIHKSAGALVLIIAVALCFPAIARAQEEGYAFSLSNFRIELMGGWAGIAPGNLNKTIENENAYLQHYYLNKYAYYDSLYGDAYAASYQYTSGREFLPLDTITPVGAAIRYQLSPTFALSLGVQYLRGERISDVGLDVAVQDTRPAASPFGASTAHYLNNGFIVSVKAWMPQLGAHFGWDMLKFLRTEIYFQGGPIIGDCRVWSQRRESVTNEEGTLSSGYRTMEITGRANSVAIELGGQLRVKLLSFLELFGQGGYSFRKLTKIHGPHTIRTVAESPVPSETNYSLSDTWGISWEKATTPWGAYSAPILTTNFNYIGAWGTYVGTTVANVDLSGLQLTAGLSIRL